MSGKALTLSSEKVSPAVQLLGTKSLKEQEPDIRPRVYTTDFYVVVALTPNSGRLKPLDSADSWQCGECGFCHVLGMGSSSYLPQCLFF